MHRPCLVLFSFLFASACTPKPADTQGDDDGSSGETGGGGVTTGGGAEETSAGATTTTSPPTTGVSDGATEVPPDPSDTGETMTTATVTTANPTDDPPDPLPAACTAICQTLAECGLNPDPETCNEECEGDAEPGSECAGLLAMQWLCAAELTCDELEKLMNEESTACADEFAATAAACGGDECTGFAGGGEGSCSVGRSCDGLVQEFSCEGDTCTCIENDVPGKTCPNMDLCAGEPDFQVLEATAQECCGWDWS